MSLRSFETGAGKVETALNRMADSFSGRKIVSDAELATRAVAEIGGATKLTGSEQAKLNALLNEAIAKYKALGLQAPDDMVKLANETKRAESAMAAIPAQTTNILGGLSKIASAVGIGFSIGAVVNFGKSVFDSASKIHDLSEQLGISIEAVQGFKYAAEQSGSSLDAVGSAITKMNQHLSAGEDSTVAALKAAGLSFSEIRKLSPEEAFLAIADAIQRVPDPMKQSELAITLFGKSAAELLPGIKEGFRGVAEGASKMSTDTVNALEAAQDAWEDLGKRVTIVTGNMIAATISATSQITSSFSNFGQFVANSMKFGVGTATMMADLSAAAQKVPPAVDEMKKSVGASTEELKKATKATNAHAEALAKIRDELTGKQAIQAAQLWTEAIRSAGGVQTILASKMGDVNKVMNEAIVAYQKQGKVAPESIRAIWAATVDLSKLLPVVQEGFPKGFERIGEAAQKAAIPLENLTTEGIRAGSALSDWLYKTGKGFGELPPKVKDVKVEFGDLAQALSQLAQVSGTTFGGIISNLSTLVASANAAQKSISQIGDAKDAFKKGSTLAGILELSSGITGLISSAVAAGKAIFNLFDRNKGRDAVKDFAESFGGFDELHKQLLTLGDAGEQLWIKLTQGVGRNNPEQAARVIAEVEEALRKQKEASEDAGGATEEQAQATIETATEAAKALEELGGKLDANKELWKDWGADVTAQLQAVADAIRSLPMPSVSNGGSLPFSAGSGSSAKIELNAPVYLDGRQIAESTAYHILN